MENWMENHSHVFTNINMLAYIRPAKFNVQILNDIKYPAKGIGVVIIKIPKTSIIILL